MRARRAIRFTARGASLSDAEEFTLPIYRYTSRPKRSRRRVRWRPDETRTEQVQLPAAAGPGAGRAEAGTRSLAGGRNARRPDLPGDVPVLLHRADDQPLPAQRDDLSGAQGPEGQEYRVGRRSCRPTSTPACSASMVCSTWTAAGAGGPPTTRIRSSRPTWSTA